jgi:uncharacterized protein YoxC
METASSLLPIIFYTLLSILVVFVIVFVYKLTKTLDKANLLLDDVYVKVKKLDNLFEVIDRGADTINMMTNKVVDVVVGAVTKVFKKKRKDEDYE